MGLSQVELEQLADDVGIDPRFIDQAVNQLEEATSFRDDSNFWGLPVEYEQERIVEGEVTGAGWEDMVAKIRKIFGSSGKVSIWGQSFEWTHSGRWGEEAIVTVMKMEGRTRIRMFWRHDRLAWSAYGPALIAGFTIAALLVSGFATIPIIGNFIYLLALAGALMPARWILDKMSHDQKLKMHRLMSRLEYAVARRPKLIESYSSDGMNVIDSDSGRVDSLSLIKAEKSE